MADWYGKGKEGTAKGGAEDMPVRHARERKETHDRHKASRDTMNKQHESELEQLAARQSTETAQTEGAPPAPGGAPAPAAAAAPAPAMPTAGG